MFWHRGSGTDPDASRGSRVADLMSAAWSHWKEMTAIRSSASSLDQFRALTRNQKALLLAQIWDSLGDFGVQSGLIVWAASPYLHARSGGQLVTALIIAGVFPRILLAPVTASLCARYPEQRIMVTSNVIRALTCLTVALLAGATLNPAVVVGMAACLAACDQVFPPARAAATARNTRVHERVFVGSVSFFSLSFVGILAAALGPVAITQGGLRLSLLAGMTAFLCSGCCTALGYRTTRDLVPARSGTLQAPRGVTGDGARRGRGFRRAVSDAFTPGAIRLVTLTGMGYGFALGVTNQTMAPFMLRGIHIPQPEYGLVPGSFAVGGLGAFVIVKRVTRQWGLSRTLIVGISTLAVSYVFFACAQNVWWASVAMLGAGLGFGVGMSVQGALLQELLEPDSMAAYIAVLTPASLLMSVIGAPLAGALAGIRGASDFALGYRLCYVTAAVVVGLSGLLRNRAIRDPLGD